MKPFLCKLFAICFLIGFTIQEAAAQTPFTTDSHVAHGGFGFGGYDVAIPFFRTSRTPVFAFTYDQGLIDNLGIGNLGVGGGLGVQFFSYDDASVDGWTRIYFGARGTYHFDFVDSDELDFYAGFFAGAYIDGSSANRGSSSSLAAGPFVGINYWFTPSFGVYAEGGFGMALLNGGVAFNF